MNANVPAPVEAGHTAVPRALPEPPSSAHRSLALVIPTYRRAALLKQGLLKMREELISSGIAVYVSDDSPDTATEEMLLGLDLPNVHYSRNPSALGHDRNVIRSLLWPTEDYVWVVGDARWVLPGGFQRVLALLDAQDFVFVNSHAPETLHAPRLDGEPARRFVRDIFWHQTLTGATVYSRRVREWLRVTAPEAEALVPNFPHLSILVDFMAAHRASLGWVGKQSLGTAQKASYWQNMALAVWVCDWSTVVRRQPSVILPHECPAVIRSHSAHMNLFNAALLLQLRQRGDLNRNYIRKHPDIWHAVHLPAWRLWAMTFAPLAFLELAQKAQRWLRGDR